MRKVGPPPDLADLAPGEMAAEADPVECSYGTNLPVQAYIR